MTTIKGTVEAVSQKDKGYGIKINEIWFNGWGKCPYEKGEIIEIEWHQKGDFKNIGPEPKAKSNQAGDTNKLIEILVQEKVNIFMTEKVNHPNGKQFCMKEYGASHTVNVKELTVEKGLEIYDLLQEIVNNKRKKDGWVPEVKHE